MFFSKPFMLPETPPEEKEVVSAFNKRRARLN
jgi:hypothetical protein